MEADQARWIHSSFWDDQENRRRIREIVGNDHGAQHCVVGWIYLLCGPQSPVSSDEEIFELDLPLAAYHNGVPVPFFEEILDVLSEAGVIFRRGSQIQILIDYRPDNLDLQLLDEPFLHEQGYRRLPPQLTHQVWEGVLNPLSPKKEN